MLSLCTIIVRGMLHLVAGHHLGHVHLVRAFQDRLGVVDDDQPFGRRPPGEAVRVMVHLRRLANEQRVELGQPGVIVAADDFGPQPQRVGRLDELVDRLFVRGRQLVGRVEQDRQVVFREACACGRSARRPAKYSVATRITNGWCCSGISPTGIGLKLLSCQLAVVCANSARNSGA